MFKVPNESLVSLRDVYVDAEVWNITDTYIRAIVTVITTRVTTVRRMIFYRTNKYTKSIRYGISIASLFLRNDVVSAVSRNQATSIIILIKLYCKFLSNTTVDIIVVLAHRRLRVYYY